MSMKLSSRRPYLVKAINEWILDNNLTPHLMVDTRVEGIMAPLELAQDGRLVLNISPSAVINLFIDEEGISFGARFGARSSQLFLPMKSILAIYAMENGQGMLFSDFPEEEESSSESPFPHEVEDEKKPSRPTLRIVK
jgi:stringent starvation protein B